MITENLCWIRRRIGSASYLFVIYTYTFYAKWNRFLCLCCRKLKRSFQNWARWSPGMSWAVGKRRRAAQTVTMKMGVKPQEMVKVSPVSKISPVILTFACKSPSLHSFSLQKLQCCLREENVLFCARVLHVHKISFFLPSPTLHIMFTPSLDLQQHCYFSNRAWCVFFIPYSADFRYWTALFSFEPFILLCEPWIVVCRLPLSQSFIRLLHGTRNFTFKRFAILPTYSVSLRWQ